MVENMSGVLAGMVRRQWWLVVLTVAVGAGAGAAIASRATVTYTGSATIAIDTATVSRVSGLPLPETVLKDLATADFRSRVASDAGVSEQVVSSGLNTYTTGSPQDRLFVDFVSTDQAEARRVAGIARAAVISRVKELADPILSKGKSLVDFNQGALKDIRVMKPDSAWEQVDARYKLWDVERQTALDATEYKLEADTYSPLADVSVVEKSKTREVATDAVGAALIGLMLGLGLAWVRERAAAKA